MLQPNDLTLFQGDSITDCGRNREARDPNVGLGAGYAHLAAATLRARRPADNLNFLNRGVSGDRITSLLARWKADCLNLQPAVVSILIGINDIWHEFGSRTGTSPRKFESRYRELLHDTREALPQARLILCEPFVTRCGVVAPEWLPVLADEQATVRKLVQEFDAAFVPFQEMFDQACREAPPAYWAADGVHPTIAGHARMAEFWISRVGAG